MSITIIGILVAVAGPILINVGFSETCSNEIVTMAPALVGGLIAWFGRVRKGDITWFGARKTV